MTLFLFSSCVFRSYYITRALLPEVVVIYKFVVPENQDFTSTSRALQRNKLKFVEASPDSNYERKNGARFSRHWLFLVLRRNIRLVFLLQWINRRNSKHEAAHSGHAVCRGIGHRLLHNSVFKDHCPEARGLGRHESRRHQMPTLLWLDRRRRHQDRSRRPVRDVPILWTHLRSDRGT